MNNEWIEHVKATRAQHGCSYMKAMRLAKETYRKPQTEPVIDGRSVASCFVKKMLATNQFDISKVNQPSAHLQATYAAKAPGDYDKATLERIKASIFYYNLQKSQVQEAYEADLARIRAQKRVSQKVKDAQIEKLAANTREFEKEVDAEYKELTDFMLKYKLSSTNKAHVKIRKLLADL